MRFAGRIGRVTTWMVHQALCWTQKMFLGRTWHRSKAAAGVQMSDHPVGRMDTVWLECPHSWSCIVQNES